MLPVASAWQSIVVIVVWCRVLLAFHWGVTWSMLVPLSWPQR
jgi:hypothetical protein